jgi:hypothetical protein
MPVRRRARDNTGAIVEPMTLGNMRENGTRSVEAECQTCKHTAIVNVDDWPAEVSVPDVGLRLRCSACGGKDIDTRPNWAERPDPYGARHHPR